MRSAHRLSTPASPWFLIARIGGHWFESGSAHYRNGLNRINAGTCAISAAIAFTHAVVTRLDLMFTGDAPAAPRSVSVRVRLQRFEARGVHYGAGRFVGESRWHTRTITGYMPGLIR